MTSHKACSTTSNGAFNMVTILHAHIWTPGVDDPQEIDLPCTDAYISGDEDDHVQFTVDIGDGKSLEVRVPAEWLKPEVLDQLLGI